MTATQEYTPLRLAEKHYKNRSLRPYGLTPSLRHANQRSETSACSLDHRPPHPPHGHSVVDLSRPLDPKDDEVHQSGWWSPENDAVEHYLEQENGQVGSIKKWLRDRRKGKARDLGERPSDAAGGHTFKQVKVGDKIGYVVAEGCILIPQYLSPTAQFHLLRSALSSYTRKPNPLSLDTHYSTPDDLFSLYVTNSPDLIPPLFESLSPEEQAQLQSEVEKSGTNHARQTIETAAAATVGFAETLRRNREYEKDTGGRDRPSMSLKGKTARELVKEMRWANLGWVYQWTTKSYDFTPQQPIEFPPDLAELCSGVVKEVPWSEVFEGLHDVPNGYERWCDDYVPDTGIVNFYQAADTLMAHVDRAELDPSRPLVSISLGHACIFLLGSSSRSDAPLPLILRSGDIFIMSGKGRQAYHGVPRIMEGTLSRHLAESKSGEDEVDGKVREWIGSARVNINVRQVFPPGFERPTV